MCVCVCVCARVCGLEIFAKTAKICYETANKALNNINNLSVDHFYLSMAVLFSSVEAKLIDEQQ